MELRPDSPESRENLCRITCDSRLLLPLQSSCADGRERSSLYVSEEEEAKILRISCTSSSLLDEGIVASAFGTADRASGLSCKGSPCLMLCNSGDG